MSTCRKSAPGCCWLDSQGCCFLFIDKLQPEVPVERHFGSPSWERLPVFSGQSRRESSILSWQQLLESPTLSPINVGGQTDSDLLWSLLL